MHTYIVAHCAHADVYNLNWLTAHCLYYCFVYHTTVDVSSASIVALALLVVDLLYAIWGQCSNAHRALQSYSYKYWSGNYSHALYFFSPSGKAKLDARIADPESAQAIIRMRMCSGCGCTSDAGTLRKQAVVPLGVDTMDSCNPTRIARHGLLLCTDGAIKIKQSRFRVHHSR